MVPISRQPFMSSGPTGMTFRIQRDSAGDGDILRLAGRIHGEYLEELIQQVKRRPGTVLDLEEVALVDASVVRFLRDCERDGVKLRHCPRFIREWIGREDDDPEEVKRQGG